MNLATMPPCHTMNTEKSGASVSRVVGRTWLVWVWAESDECESAHAHWCVVSGAAGPMHGAARTCLRVRRKPL